VKTETSTVDPRWRCLDERHKTRYEAFETPMFTYPAETSKRSLTCSDRLGRNLLIGLIP